MKLSRISLALIPLLTAFSTTAAVYQVVELETNNVSRANFAAALNDQGDAIVSGQGYAQWNLADRFSTPVNDVFFINFPLDVTTIDFEHADITSRLTPEQIEDAKQGIFDAVVLRELSLILGARRQLTNQPVGSSVAISYPENTTPLVVPLRDFDQLRSNSELIIDINNQGVAVGTASAPYSKQDFTTTPDPDDEDAEAPETITVWQPEAGFQYGVAVTNVGPVNLLPPYTELGGGFSRGFSVNNQNLVAGSGSVGLSENTTTNLETTCNGMTEPAVFCLNALHQELVYTFAGLQAEIRAFETVRVYRGGYQERAMLWQVQADGSATVSQTYGFLGEKGTGEIHEPVNNLPNVVYYSTANAINDNGIAVGHSMYSDRDKVFTITTRFERFQRIYAAPHATLYRDGEVSAMVDPQQWLASNAVDINNNNIVTGHAIKTINGSRRNKFFYYDVAADNIVFPEDFFLSSSSIPAAINDNGQIVGRAEVVIGGTTTRRQHGFVYDITSNTFQDLNKLVGCNADFTVVEASAINNNGEILATVLQSMPQRDAKGEPMLDASGNPVMTEQARAVKLLPIANGEQEDCNTEQNTYERKAGGFGGIGLLLLATFGWLYRRRR